VSAVRFWSRATRVSITSALSPPCSSGLVLRSSKNVGGCTSAKVACTSRRKSGSRNTLKYNNKKSGQSRIRSSTVYPTSMPRFDLSSEALRSPDLSGRSRGVGGFFGRSMLLIRFIIRVIIQFKCMPKAKPKPEGKG